MPTPSENLIRRTRPGHSTDLNTTQEQRESPGGGYGIHWPDIDEDLSTEGLLRGCPGPGQGLFNWGVPWKKSKRYESLDAVQSELSLAKGCKVAEFHVEDYSSLDLRVPPTAPPRPWAAIQKVMSQAPDW